jgi:hypothetical protein
MQAGDTDWLCVHYKGMRYRAIIVPATDLMGRAISVLWIGPAHHVLPAHCDDVARAQLGRELLAQWDSLGRLKEIAPDSSCAEGISPEQMPPLSTGN